MLLSVARGRNDSGMAFYNSRKAMKKNTNIIIIGVISVLVLAGLIWFARPSPSNNNNLANVSSGPPASLGAEESDFDFGQVSMASGKVSHLFKIKNTGGQDLAINKMYTSCMCTIATLISGGKKFGPFGMAGHGFIPKINASVVSGSEADVEVVFDPAAHGPAGVGLIQRVIYLETSAGEKQFGIKAVVIP
ncbi:MAG: hypothetical protein A3G49_06170 [Candidatus Sungbacteria bacterium RIFCSPLOWO2_12_FULL_41_11]|uniref:DUF1573 domain-containing protein n=1 Tax=Candidatus Sungbacteria bacterium RIFCSPLOWO2_12_FULL_41_11 TaxID=1802286 RepID=A0A1G2LT44_9BACT|nr:MAG: hypothetical protein A3G49_06170 [Candidatus Sungbacteria bacterium RIFCSPLOWO2_12_FULL_41_11]